jgi:general secretion pathway protein D
LTLGTGQLLAQNGSVKAGEPVTLNFAGAEIEAVARTLATLSGRNVVVDPRVKGTITLVTERPVTPAAAWNQFLAMLRLQGFTVVEAAGLYKVVPEADGKLQSGGVSDSTPAVAGNQIVTQIFRLNYENANNLVPVLRPLISPNNTINVNPGNNSLVITDYADNLQRIARIVAVMDVANASDVEIIRLQHAIATDLAPLVLRLIDSGSTAPAAGQGQADTSFKTTLVAEPRSNALILRAANPARVALVRALISKLDQPNATTANGNAGNIYVVYLKNADATKLATTLRAAMSATGSNLTTTGTSLTSAPGSSAAAAASATGQSSGSANQPSTGGQIQADPTTNSLIITAPEPQYRQLRAVIDKLDGRRAQVLVESLIVEVSSDKAAEFGIQWQGVVGRMGLGTNFGTGSSNLASLATSIASGSASTAVSKGFNLGVATKIGGNYVLGALGRMLDETGTGNVLSTPNLLTLDNEEAKIVIGQNVPFVTGSYNTNSSSSSGGSVNPFTTIERKDVGLTLRVRPQINENGTVKLAIYQEVSSVDAATKNSNNGPTTNKRSIESNVLVDDGAIIVLGGLLQDDYSNTKEQIPMLGDVPVFGNLFKSETRTRKKTNLMVFLRPTVVRDAATGDAVTLDRYDMMQSQQKASLPQAHMGLSSISDAFVLPDLAGAQGASRRVNAPRPPEETPAR